MNDERIKEIFTANNDGGKITNAGIKLFFDEFLADIEPGIWEADRAGQVKVFVADRVATVCILLSPRPIRMPSEKRINEALGIA